MLHQSVDELCSGISTTIGVAQLAATESEMTYLTNDTTHYRIEFEQEEDGRWIADMPELPGVMAYGSSKREAESKVQVIALQVQGLPFVQ